MQLTGKYDQLLRITEDSTLPGMAVGGVHVTAGVHLHLSGSAKGLVVEPGASVHMSGNVSGHLVNAGDLEITGRAKFSSVTNHGSILVAVGAFWLNGVLNSDGTLSEPTGSYSIDSETPRFALQPDGTLRLAN